MQAHHASSVKITYLIMTQCPRVFRQYICSAHDSLIQVSLDLPNYDSREFRSCFAQILGSIWPRLQSSSQSMPVRRLMLERECPYIYGHALGTSAATIARTPSASFTLFRNNCLKPTLSVIQPVFSAEVVLATSKTVCH